MTIPNASSCTRLLTPSFSLYRFVISRTSGAQYICPLSSRTARLTKSRQAQAVTRRQLLDRPSGSGSSDPDHGLAAYLSPTQGEQGKWAAPGPALPGASHSMFLLIAADSSARSLFKFGLRLSHHQLQFDTCHSSSFESLCRLKAIEESPRGRLQSISYNRCSAQKAMQFLHERPRRIPEAGRLCL